MVTEIITIQIITESGSTNKPFSSKLNQQGSIKSATCDKGKKLEIVGAYPASDAKNIADALTSLGHAVFELDVSGVDKIIISNPMPNEK